MDDLLQTVPEPAPPRLWNPVAAAWWSLLLSPAFGAWLHAANWRTLGDRERAKSNMIVVWLFALFLAGNLGTMFLPDSKLIDNAMKGAGIAFLVGWYQVEGRNQIKHVKESLGGRYEKRRWGLPLFVGFFAVIAYVAIIFGTVFLTYEPGVDDVSADVRQSILEEWHGKPELKDATIERILLKPKGKGEFTGFIEATFRGKPERLSLEVTYKDSSLSYKVTPRENE